jgi:hypothetical protein
LAIFGSPPHKDPQTQLLTCPKCGQLVPPHWVVEAIGGMRFINEVYFF